MKKGDLVRNRDDDRLGVVLDVVRDQARLFMGGLPFIVAADHWEVVPFYPGATIPANFEELVAAYQREKAALGEKAPSEQKELTLGPRWVTAGGRVLGTCDGLTLTIAESTQEEIEELEKAHNIGLVRMGKG